VTVPRLAPPAPAERLLQRMLGDGEWSESILGDLHEEYVTRATRAGKSARSWYWLQTIRIGTRALVRRASRPRHPRYRSHLTVPPTRKDSLMRTLTLEIRHSFRALLKRPAMSAIVVLTLALGLGANAVVFSMIDALIVRPFTLREIDRLTLLSYQQPDDIDKRNGFTPADFLDAKKEQRLFDRFAAFQWWDANLVGRDEPEAVQGFFVSADFFPALGVELAMGRGFLASEEVPGQHRRVILGHGLWERRFASDPAIIGKAIEVDGVQYEVVGIAPSGFEFPMGAQVWAPLSFKPGAATDRRTQSLTAIGHLAPGTAIEDAKAQMAVIGDRLTREHPDTNKGREARVYTLTQGMRDLGLVPLLSLWQASAIFVLLIAGANVANLLLARGAERQREMAVRLAIGASRARVIREHLIESGLLALAAVPGALAIAWVGSKSIVSYMPAKIARFVEGWYAIDVDGRLIGYTILLACVTALLFGVIPAIQSSRPRLAESLKEGGRSSTTGGGRLRLRRALVVAEIALVLPLLVATALSVTTVNRFLYGPQGYEPNGLLTMQTALPEARYPDPGSRRRFAEAAVEHLRQLPGVQGVAISNVVPASDNNAGRTIEIEGHPNPDPANPPSVDYRAVTPDFLSVLEIPLIKGRGITDADREHTLPVAVVSQSLANKYWPGQDPIGRRIKVGTDANARWATVVGICGDTVQSWFIRRNYPTLYVPFDQAPTGYVGMVLRSGGDPALLSTSAKAAIRVVDPSQPLFEVTTVRQALSDRTVGLQFVGGLMFAFGAVALVLALVGVYGVMAHMVTQRTHEIGVRMALGATRKDVLGLTVRQTGTVTAIGVGAGLVLSVALNRLIEAGLVGVASTDPRLVALLALALIVVALGAGYLPARRAASIDPMRALRAE
jgi:putative ABC transport system permease protein